MLRTPHEHADGGTAAVLRLSAREVKNLVSKVNDELGQENFMQLVRFNSPNSNSVAGPREGLDYMKTLAQLREVSNYLFHNSVAMGHAAKTFGVKLKKLLDSLKPELAPKAKPEIAARIIAEHVFALYRRAPKGEPQPFMYASSATGKIVPVYEIVEDLAAAPAIPVKLYTKHWQSLHGTLFRNGFLDVIGFHQELGIWFESSDKVATSIITDYTSMQATITRIMDIVNGKVAPGPQRATAPARQPSLQPSPLRPQLYRA